MENHPTKTSDEEGKHPMKNRLFTTLLAGLLVAGLVASAPVATAKKKKKPAGPVVVGTDPADDWGTSVDPELAPLGNALGMELTEASIGMADASTVNFVIKLNSLPPTGGTPEFVRYQWDFSVDGEARVLDGKFTNYTRGVCDPTGGACPPPRDPGMQPFLLRGACGPHAVVTNLIVCEELGIYKGVFDSAAGTITIAVPLEALGAKAGSKIAPAANTIGGTISAAPAAYVSSGNLPYDTLTVLKTYTVPR